MMLRLIRSLLDRAVLVRLILVDLVPDLGAGFSSSELPAELEARVPVDSDLSAVDDLQIEAVDCLLSLFASGVLHEAEPARSLLHFIESHYQTHHLPALAEKL